MLIKTFLGPALRTIYKRFFKESGSAVEGFLDAVKSVPNKTALIFTLTGEIWTYKKLNEDTNKLSNFLIENNLVESKQVVSIFLPNSPEFIKSWLGLWKLGQTCSFINTNLKGNSLLHALKVSNSRYIVTDENLLEEVLIIKENLMDLKVVVLSTAVNGEEKFGLLSKDVLLFNENMSDAIIEPHNFRKNVLSTDVALLIFTSGTTGLPKPATLTHEKFRILSNVPRFFGLGKNDRIYTALPLYHTAGATLGFGNSIYNCSTIIIAPKFSASKFFYDCKRFDATAFQYIGELARYLLTTPESTNDKNHSVRIAFGNGLRKDIWLNFKSRFNIMEIGEFYGSTEGNASMHNHQVGNDGIGAVGRAGPIASIVFCSVLIEYDQENDIHPRNAKGFCKQVPYGVEGELIGKIQTWHPTRNFAESRFRTGDLLRKERDQRYYFVDRVGDTFRWKGENVSTGEILGAISKFDIKIQEAVVYGVEVPYMDGKAGAVALKVDEDFKLNELYGFFKSEGLPSYAIPIWIRILKKVELTGTFKPIKHQLQVEGIDLKNFDKDDKIFWVKPGSNEYVEFTKSDYQDIIEKKVRL
ncbi:hypothetical protein HK099_000048 [Clydaea vesicula]|uniref:AMP-dependent synthetase/ligase domain-containing protein n=1 Tax=Clydaea vesicula TaxID=447962 RepID=A0AAD5U8P4_9FUNG|nr:hypothetical protein HK099_000048 [Clydaea vesicula]